MKTKLCFFLLLFSLKLFAQVHIQTGTPQINFPLFSLTDDPNRLSTSISLNYVGGNGIKVNSMASNCGTGWNIDFGGYIIREIHGEPDDQKQNTTFNLPTNITEYNQYIDNYYPNGFLYSEFNATTLMTNVGAQSRVRNAASNENPLDPVAPKVAADREQDIFMFNFNGQRGKFVFGKNGSASPILLLNESDTKLKISVEHDVALLGQNIRTTIKKFKIIDEFGVEYFFEEMELSEVIKYIKREVWTGFELNKAEILGSNTSYAGFCNLPLSTSTPVISWNTANESPSQLHTSKTSILKGVRTGKFICNRWLLTKIKNPNTGQTINFSYSSIPIVTETAHTAVKNTNENGSSLSITIGLLSEITKRINFIESNTTKEKIMFNYGVQRKDPPYDFVLDNITHIKNNHSLYKYSFSYAYFYKQNIRPINDTYTEIQMPFLRLALTSFKKVSITSNLEEKPTNFSYYIGSDVLNPPGDYVPPPFSLFHDHWGYYNFGGPNVWDISSLDDGGFVGFNEHPKKCFPYKKEIYKHSVGVTYTDFRDIPLSAGFDLGARAGLIKSVQNPMGGKTIYNYEGNTVNLGGNMKRVGGVRVKSVILDDGIHLTNNQIKEYVYLKNDGVTSSGLGYDAPVYSTTKPVNFYTCGYAEPTTGMVPKQFAAAAQTYLLTTISVNGLLGAVALDPFTFVITLGISLWNLFNPPPDFINLSSTFTSSEPLNLNNPLPLIYSRIEVKSLQNTIPIGKDVFTFTSPDIYPIEIPILSAPFSSKQRFLDFKYGLLKSHEIRNANNQLLKKIEHNYQTTQTTNTNSIYGSQKWSTNSELFNCANSLLYNDFGVANRIVSDVYYPIVGKINLIQSNEYNYNMSGSYTLNTTDFEYNNYNQVNKKVQFNSKGEKIETIHKYVNDYSSTGVNSSMQLNNMGLLPVLTETYIYKNGNTDKYLLNGTINRYAILSNTDIKPKKIFQFFAGEIANPIPVLNSAVIAFNPAVIVRDPNYYKEISNVEYNDIGQHVEISANKRTESFVYALGNPNQIIATVKNASRSNIAYSSFEENTENSSITNIQEWNYNKSYIWNEDALSGNSCYKFTSSVTLISKSNLSPSNTYRITFWAKNTTNQNYIPNNLQVYVSTSLATNGSNIPVEKIYTNPVTGWALYQCFVQSTNAINIHNQNFSNGGVGNPMLIDEIRIYPKSAQMSTVAYNELGLKITEVDLSDKVTYYEYDALGRIRLVRDELKNVIKTYEYNFKN